MRKSPAGTGAKPRSSEVNSARDGAGLWLRLVVSSAYTFRQMLTVCETKLYTRYFKRCSSLEFVKKAISLPAL